MSAGCSRSIVCLLYAVRAGQPWHRLHAGCGRGGEGGRHKVLLHKGNHIFYDVYSLTLGDLLCIFPRNYSSFFTRLIIPGVVKDV